MVQTLQNAPGIGAKDLQGWTMMGCTGWLYHLLWWWIWQWVFYHRFMAIQWEIWWLRLTIWVWQWVLTSGFGSHFQTKHCMRQVSWSEEWDARAGLPAEESKPNFTKKIWKASSLGQDLGRRHQHLYFLVIVINSDHISHISYPIEQHQKHP